MKLAVDVKGTLEGSKKKQVLKLIELFQAKGYEVTVWSNWYGYAVDAIKDNNLTAYAADKRMKGDFDYEESHYFDFAIEDDRTQTWLAAKKFIFVDEIPGEEETPLFFERLFIDPKSEDWKVQYKAAQALRSEGKE